MRRWLTTMTLDGLAAVENRLAMMRARLKWARWQHLRMRIGRDGVLPLSSAAEYAQKIAQEASGRPRYTTETIAESLRRPETRKALREELARGIILVDKVDSAGIAPGDDQALKPWPRSGPAR